MKLQKKMKISLRAKLLSVFLTLGATAILQLVQFTAISDLGRNGMTSSTLELNGMMATRPDADIDWT